MKYEITKSQITIDSEGAYLNTTIDEFLHFYNQSKKNQYLLIQNKLLFIDNECVKNKNTIIGKHKLTLLLPEVEIDWPMSDQPCSVVYEDPFAYIVHKEPRCIIHGEPDDTSCLNAQAARYQYEQNIHQPVRPIHRLDRETQGLVFYAKIPFFQPWFDQQLSEKKIARNYLAICYGKASVGQKFTFKQKLAKDRHSNNKYRVSPSGVEAITHVECIAQKGPYVLMKCGLETGRTHQIRVHLSSNGFPIVNDSIYGSPSKDFQEMGLWANELIFRNPITRKKHKIHDFVNKDYTFFE